MKRSIIAFAVLLLAVVPVMAQLYCPSHKGLVPQSTAFLCDSSYPVDAAWGGGVLQVCLNPPIGGPFISWSGGNCGTDVIFRDVVIIHQPIRGDKSPYWSFSFNNGSGSANFNGFFNGFGIFIITGGAADGMTCPFGGC